jgi:hypothetical protein
MKFVRPYALTAGVKEQLTMTDEAKQEYRFLDTEADRTALVEDIRRTRRDLLNLVNLVPQDRWYEPRYHGWSLAAMLAHLQLQDRLLMWNISLALLGIQIPIPRQYLNSFNDAMANIFRRRVVETTVRGLENNESRITDFIMRLPLDKFSRRVYDPASEKTLTIEQALQEFFLYHWQEHLQTMRLADDIHYEPPVNTV